MIGPNAMRAPLRTLDQAIDDTIRNRLRQGRTPVDCAVWLGEALGFPAFYAAARVRRLQREISGGS